MSKEHEEFKQAVALAYTAGQTAPKVVAAGKGLVADNIIRLAQEHGVYVHESKELVAMLMMLIWTGKSRQLCIGWLLNCWPGSIVSKKPSHPSNWIRLHTRFAFA